MTARPDVVVRVSHKGGGDMPDYHTPVFVGYVRADCTGRPNPRMYDAMWQFWRCNNGDCPGEFFVSDSAIRDLIEVSS